MPVTVTPDDEGGDGESVPLRPSAWNYWRPFHTGHAGLAGCIPLPVVLVGAGLRSPSVMLGGVLLIGLAWLLAIRAQRDAFFTRTRIHRRRGLLGVTAENVPIDAVDEVVVDPVEWLPDMGTLTVRAGARHMQFECVPHAESRARMMLVLAELARDRKARSRAEACELPL
jgi:hypothetical protein